MVMLSKRTVVLAKIESAYGVDPTLAAADNAVEAYDFDVPEIAAEMKERNPGNSDLSPYPELRGKTGFTYKLKVPLKGSGTAGTAPRIAPLLRSAGLGQTIVSSTSVTYAPISTGWESCAIEGYIDGLLYKLLGCVSDLEMDFTTGEKPLLNVSGKALYTIPTDGDIVTPTFDTTTPEICKGTVMTFGSYAAILEKLNIKFNNKISERIDMTPSEGVKGYQIVERNYVGTMTVEAVLRATTNADFFSYFDGGTAKALSFVIGATSGNIATITAPKCYLRAPKVGNRDGIRTFELEFLLARNSGNDEISIALT